MNLIMRFFYFLFFLIPSFSPFYPFLLNNFQFRLAVRKYFTALRPQGSQMVRREKKRKEKKRKEKKRKEKKRKEKKRKEKKRKEKKRKDGKRQTKKIEKLTQNSQEIAGKAPSKKLMKEFGDLGSLFFFSLYPFFPTTFGFPSHVFFLFI